MTKKRIAPLALCLLISGVMADAQTKKPLKAKVNCTSQQTNSRGNVYGGSNNHLGHTFRIVLNQGETLHLNRFTGRYEAPQPGCVGIDCVQPIYEGDRFLKITAPNSLSVYDGNRVLLSSGEGKLDLSAVNGFVCLIDVEP